MTTGTSARAASRELFPPEVIFRQRHTNPGHYFVFKDELSAAYKKIKNLEDKLRYQNKKIAELERQLERIAEDRQQIDTEKALAFKEINWITDDQYNAIRELVPEFPSLYALQRRKKVIQNNLGITVHEVAPANDETDGGPFVYVDLLDRISHNRKMSKLDPPTHTILLHADAYLSSNNVKGKKETTITFEMIDIASKTKVKDLPVIDIFLIKGSDSNRNLRAPFQLLDAMIAAAKQKGFSVCFSADMCTLLSVVGIGSVQATHNCCFCKISNKDYKHTEKDVLLRTIPNLIESYQKREDSVKYSPLLKNLDITDYKMCSLHFTLRMGEQMLKRILNFSLYDETAEAQLTQILKEKFHLNWDKAKTRDSKHFKKIALDRHDVSELAMNEDLFMELFADRPCYETMKNAWRCFARIVKTLNLQCAYSKEQMSELDLNLQSLQNFLKIGLNKFTPYCHWIRHIRSAIQRDGCFGLYTTQENERKHSFNKRTFRHSSKGGGGEGTLNNLSRRLQKEMTIETLQNDKLAC